MNIIDLYITMNNLSAHPSYSHYYLLSPSTLFFSFFAHLIVFCTSYCFLHILLFCTFFYFIAHLTLISHFLTICMPLCYITLYNLYSYYFALSTERTWFDYISLLIIPCITIMWQIKKPWPWPWPCLVIVILIQVWIQFSLFKFFIWGLFFEHNYDIHVLPT